jgi:hypothetical protein
MARDASNLIGGPASFLLSATEIGHTQGGINATVTPEQRAVTVDEFGTAPCDMRHTGGSAQVVARMAEYTAATLAEVIASGNDQTAAAGAKYMGFGRSAGFIHVAQGLTVVPLLTADAAKKFELFRATASSPIELAYNNDNDVIFETTFTGLVDESKDDGEVMGKIHLTAS